MTIDGTSAPGYTATPVVQINYNNFAGLKFNSNAAGSSLLSLSLVRSSGAGVTLNGGGHVLLTGNYIGVDLNGTTAAANKGDGIDLASSSFNTIGGDTAQDRNLISANRKSGVSISGGSYNEVLGNYIGTDVTGTLDLGNANSGVVLTSSTSHNIIGGTNGNVISGNDSSGVLLKGGAKLNTVSANLIGVDVTGTAALGNGSDGVKIDGAKNNIIGNTDPISEINYFNADDGTQITTTVQGWQGIRAAATPGQYMITGTSGLDGVLFIGTLDGNTGTTYWPIDVPNMYQTTIYCPDLAANGDLILVGTYRALQNSPVVHGFVFQGTTADLGDPAHYRTIDYPGAQYTYVHSVDGGLVVGNYDDVGLHALGGLQYGPGKAFIYNIATGQFITDVAYPSSKSNSVYAIWYNGGTSYTLAGGYSNGFANNFADQSQPIGHAFLVDYNAATGTFSHWTTYDDPSGKNLLTHFEGLSSVEPGVYTIAADSAQLGTGSPALGSFVTVRRNADGSFGPASWVPLHYSNLPTTYITSADAVYGNAVVGPVIGGGFNYQAQVNTAFTLSNVISGNGASGIDLVGASGNQIAMNYIGTDVTGTVDLGNAASGILITSGSMNNMVGGEVSGGNNPTGGTFVQPPLGNVISGNNGDGVKISSGASKNQLSGNFIGTDATGSAALGNSGDGVAIIKANSNSLIGCTFVENPFVYYNVIGGNAGNGLVVDNSNNTTIQANFFGLGADNNTPVGNAGSGVVVEGTSSHTTLGGPLPLGNVTAANLENGVLLEDKASFFISYNTFSGVSAFGSQTNLGNGENGFFITATGGHNLLRTCVVSENLENGIEIANSAKDIDIVGNIVGLNWNGVSGMGNGGNGIEVNGNAHDILIGGPQPTFNVVPQNTISGNAGSGIDIQGSAHKITVNNSYIGTDVFGLVAVANGLHGVAIGSGTKSNTIGSTDPALKTIISGNTADGIALSGTQQNTIQGSWIGLDRNGHATLGNGANGIYITSSSKNMIGGTAAGAANTVTGSGGSGVAIASGNRNGIIRNSIFDNALLGIDLSPGANNNQVAPALLSVQTRSQEIQVYGTLTSIPKTSFTLDFYASKRSQRLGANLPGLADGKDQSQRLHDIHVLRPAPPNRLRLHHRDRDRPEQ